MKRRDRGTTFILTTLCIALLGVCVSGVNAAEILFIGANADPTFGDDGFVFDYLTDELGHDVIYVQASASITEDAEGVDLIILSSTPGSGDMRGKFNQLSTPILNWEEALMDGNTAAGNFSMGQGSENGTALPGIEIEILNPNHPLAAGLSGIVEFADAAIPNPHITGALGPGVLGIAGFPAQAGEGIELSPSTDGLHLGTNQTQGNPFSGLLDEMAIWDRELSFTVDANQNLTGGEVHTVYSQGIRALGNANPGPIGYWSFDDDSDDTIAVDDSGNGFDGILVGGSFLEAGSGPEGVGGEGALLLYNDPVLGAGSVDVELMQRPGGNLTYSFWFNADSTTYGDDFSATGDPRADFFYGDGSVVRPHLSANRGGRPVGLYVNADGDLATPIEAQTDTFTTDEWHHVLITWDGDVGSVFVDGKLDNQVRLDSPNQFTITAVEAGGLLMDGTEAPGPRVNFPIQDTGFALLTEDGLALFDAAIDWLLGGGTPMLPGDYDNNGVLDADDLDLQAAVAIGELEFDPKFDENGDTFVDLADRQIWLSDHKKTWMGDSNLDFQFNTGDFVQVLSAGKYETGQRAGWAEGDWDGNLKFDTGDLVVALSGGGYEQGLYPDAGVAAVPEPSSLVLLTLALGFLCARRRGA